ncbi:hypothetical protein ACFPJ1_34300 [Kribbella qitaiheensis]|uniref:ATP-dependent DNA ligase n=1 Tax=Kribbella qitaiheensis TaxID=1544730 RepID=UPI003614E779
MGKLAPDLLGPVGLELARAGRWVPPLQVSPVTADVDEAREWLDAFKSSGVEGLVVKGASTRYQPGRHWVKVNSVGVGGVRQLACTLTGLVRRWIVVVRTCTTPVVDDRSTRTQTSPESLFRS